jgi:hypothetical protein
MTLAQPFPVSHAQTLVSIGATLALALAACSSSPTASPSASVRGSPAAEPTASQAQTPSPSASAYPVIASPGAIGQSQTIHLTLRPGNDTYVPVGSLTGCTNKSSCQGDYLIGDDQLFDATTGKEVGTLAYVEFVVKTGDTLFHSPANTITLTGRGQIVFSETLYDDGSGRPATGAITGGTGEFLGATGEVVSRSLRGSGDFVITITK